VFARADRDIPTGTVSFKAAATNPLRLGARASPRSWRAAKASRPVRPHRPDGEGCSSNCEIASIEYRWMERVTAAGSPLGHRALADAAGRIDVSRLAPERQDAGPPPGTPDLAVERPDQLDRVGEPRRMLQSDLAEVTTGQNHERRYELSMTTSEAPEQLGLEPLTSERLRTLTTAAGGRPPLYFFGVCGQHR